MKIGDLVELSSAGQNTLYCRNLRSKRGLIVEIRPKKDYMYPIVVNWFGAGRTTHLRSHLKYLSKA
jgi:hypothetical protein